MTKRYRTKISEEQIKYLVKIMSPETVAKWLYDLLETVDMLEDSYEECQGNLP